MVIPVGLTNITIQGVVYARKTLLQVLYSPLSKHLDYPLWVSLSIDVSSLPKIRFVYFLAERIFYLTPKVAFTLLNRRSKKEGNLISIRFH